MKKIKDKKGFLLGEETIKIIIALICIVFLAGFLFLMYRVSVNKQDLEQATASLEHLIDEVNLEEERVEIFNPEKWIIVSFEGNTLPNSCLAERWESCLCICKVPIGGIRNVLNTCNTNGICEENDFTVQGKLKTKQIEIKNPPLVLEIDYENKIIKELEWQTG